MEAMERLGPFVVKNWLLFVALIVILALLFVNLTKSRLLGFREVKADEAVRLMNHEDAVVIDTRAEEDFARGHILGAVSMPFATLQDRLAELEAYRGRPVIVYCEHGRQSGQAGAALKKNGFERIVGLAGGLAAWRGAGLPLVKT
jgi:rhodanese-related sulfurtransferase